MNELSIPKQIFNEMLAYCREGVPDEVCGILAGDGNRISKLYKIANADSSPVSYLMDSRDQFRVMKDMRENGLSMLAIFHSHPASTAYPSNRDVDLAFYEDCVYVIMSLIQEEPVSGAFLIRGGHISEAALTID